MTVNRKINKKRKLEGNEISIINKNNIVKLLLDKEDETIIQQNEDFLKNNECEKNQNINKKDNQKEKKETINFNNQNAKKNLSQELSNKVKKLEKNKSRSSKSLKSLEDDLKLKSKILKVNSLKIKENKNIEVKKSNFNNQTTNTFQTDYESLSKLNTQVQKTFLYGSESSEAEDDQFQQTVDFSESEKIISKRSNKFTKSFLKKYQKNDDLSQITEFKDNSSNLLNTNFSYFKKLDLRKKSNESHVKDLKRKTHHFDKKNYLNEQNFTKNIEINLDANNSNYTEDDSQIYERPKVKSAYQNRNFVFKVDFLQNNH